MEKIKSDKVKSNKSLYPFLTTDKWIQDLIRDQLYPSRCWHKKN